MQKKKINKQLTLDDKDRKIVIFQNRPFVLKRTEFASPNKSFDDKIMLFECTSTDDASHVSCICILNCQRHRNFCFKTATCFIASLNVVCICVILKKVNSYC